MKILIKIFLIFIATNFIYAQNGWHEITNLKDATLIHISRSIPNPYISIKNQGALYFKANTAIYSFKYRINGGGWINVNLSNPSQIIGPVYQSWPDTGLFTIDWEWRDVNSKPVDDGCSIFIVPEKQRRYEDNDGNTIDVWQGGSSSLDRPVLIVEGFDSDNTDFPLIYYKAATNFFEEIRSRDADIYLLNFAQGGQNIRLNADVVTYAVNYINSIQTSSQRIIIAGLSMGGVIVRYCLVDNEDNGTPLPISHFLSLDSPQQGAIISKKFQDYLKNNSPTNSELNSLAAKQMLKYDTYDTQDTHTTFYDELNSKGNLGNGYPSYDGIVNIGVAFSPNEPHSHSGTWIKIKYQIGPTEGTWHSFNLDPGDPELEAGSFLPQQTGLSYSHFSIPWKFVGVVYEIHPLYGLLGGFFNFLGAEFWTERQYNREPTFIPHVSALDIVNGQSKFDVVVVSNEKNYHDHFPTGNDVISGKKFVVQIADLLYLGSESMINITFNNELEDETDLGGNLKVIDSDNITHTVTSGNSIPLFANKVNSVETIEQKRINWSGTGENYQHHHWNDAEDNYQLKTNFRGYENNGTEKAKFLSLDNYYSKYISYLFKFR